MDAEVCHQPIIGFSSAERIDEALSARGEELTADEEKYLEEAYRLVEIDGCILHSGFRLKVIPV